VHDGTSNGYEMILFHEEIDLGYLLSKLTYKISELGVGLGSKLFFMIIRNYASGVRFVLITAEIVLGQLSTVHSSPN
jgi:hypothetical protein